MSKRTINDYKPIQMLVLLLSFYFSFSFSYSFAADPFGTIIGTFNNVPAHSNCSNLCTSCNNNCQSYNYINGNYIGIKWQCVEYVRRYYYEVYDMDLASLYKGDANTFYDNAGNMGLERFASGGITAPIVGDILVSNGGEAGHIAIIKSVSNSQICTIQQNFSNDKKDGDRCLLLTETNGHYYISGFSPSYPIQGWLRPPKSYKVKNIAPILSLLLSDIDIAGTWSVNSVPTSVINGQCYSDAPQPVSTNVLITVSGNSVTTEWSNGVIHTGTLYGNVFRDSWNFDRIYGSCEMTGHWEYELIFSDTSFVGTGTTQETMMNECFCEDSTTTQINYSISGFRSP